MLKRCMWQKGDRDDADGHKTETAKRNDQASGPSVQTAWVQISAPLFMNMTSLCRSSTSVKEE